MSRLKQKIEFQESNKTIFIDFFDTLVHRTVHPNYPQKLWGKFLVRELGLSIDRNLIVSIRAEALSHISQKQKLAPVEVDYNSVIIEVYQRLINSNLLFNVPFDHFKQVFERADYSAEISVQFKNKALIEDLHHLKKEGSPIYLVSDFYLPKKLISQILDFHGISYLFEDVFRILFAWQEQRKGHYLC